MTKPKKISTENKAEKKNPSKLNSIAGIVSLPTNFDEKKVLRDYFENKHLSK